MNSTRFLRFKQCLLKRQTDFTLISDGVHKAQNLSALIRTCDAVGIATMNMVQPAWEKFRLFPKTAGGSSNWVEQRTFDTTDEAIAQAREEGKKIIVTHLGPEAVDFRQVDYTQPCAIVVGAEKFGVSETAVAQADELITIPMMGLVESLNVSVASALILFEAQNQKNAAGHYEQPQLDATLFKTTLFRWTHPKVAQYCDEKKLPYPEIDEDTGHLINGLSWYNEFHI